MLSEEAFEIVCDIPGHSDIRPVEQKALRIVLADYRCLMAEVATLKNGTEIAEWERYEWAHKPWICWGEFLDAMNDMTIDERDEALAAWRKNIKALD